VESTQAAFEAGATIAHVHVRKDDQTPTSDPERFAALLAGLRKHCPGMIVQFSTGGRSGKGSERGGMLHLGCDMASLSTGSCNFPSIIYENHPDLIRELAQKMLEHGVKPEIEVFDLSMLYQALRLADEGLLRKPLHVQFVMGVKNAMPVIRQAFDFMVDEVTRLSPESTGSRRESAGTSWKSTAGASNAAAIAARGWRTTSAGTKRALRHRMRNW
jgi:3-keto-5-aminohexanoate cleavage enzyme